MRRTCRYDCNDIFPGRHGTIEGTCALDERFVLKSNGCTPPWDAAPDAPADAASDASDAGLAGDTDAAVDAALDAPQDG